MHLSYARTRNALGACILTLAGLLASPQPVIAAEPPVKPAAITVHIAKGDEAVYAGRAKMTYVEGKTTKSTVDSAIKLTALVVAPATDERWFNLNTGGWIVSHMWEATPEPKPGPVTLVIAPGTELQFAHVTPDDHGEWEGDSTRYSDCPKVGGVMADGPREYLPAMPRTQLKLGQKWSADMMVDHWVRALVRCEAKMTEQVNGRPCMRIDMTSSLPLPAPISENMEYEGAGVLAKVKLTRLDGHMWVDQDTGWVVKYQLKYQQRSNNRLSDSGKRVASTTDSEINLDLKSTRRVPDDELGTISKQIDRIQAVDKQITRLQYSGSADVEGWREVVRELISFEKDYPKSPYIRAVRKTEEKSRNALARAKSGKESQREPSMFSLPRDI